MAALTFRARALLPRCVPNAGCLGNADIYSSRLCLWSECTDSFTRVDTMQSSVSLGRSNSRSFTDYSRHLRSARDKHDELVWVNKWYNPDDLRSSAPVQRHKFLAQPLPELSSLPSYWVPLCEAPLKSFSRAAEEKHIHVSSPSSRCEEWSTLRQMLPSKGQCKRCSHPKWGTGMSTPPTWSTKNLKRFPHINSPMTE